MRITHIIPGLTYERGGTSTVLEALVRHQAAGGLQVTLLRTDQGVRNGEQSVALDPRVRECVAPVVGPDRVAYSPRFAQLVRAEARQCDIFHVHSVFTYPVHVALKVARATGKPVILSPHGILHRRRLRMSPWQKRAYLLLWGSSVRRACSAWHFTSKEEATNSWPFDDSPRFVLGLGIDPAPFMIDRVAARREVAIRWPHLGETPFVLFLGRIHPLKRPELLLEAFLASAPPQYKLVFAGPDEVGLWANMAGRHLRSPAVARRVAYLGTVIGPDKYALLAAARLFALPSEYENFGVTVIEALAAGTPVLASDSVDAARLATGLAERLPFDLASWKVGLARVLAEEDVPASWSEFARQRVRDEFGWQPLVTRLIEHYKRLLAS